MSAVLEETTATLEASVQEPKPARPGRGGSRRRTAGDWVVLLVAIVLGLLIAVPFLLILINSFKSPTDYNTCLLYTSPSPRDS